ncbi:hypothetical protein EV659_1098 [Rhodothalassium salexigens DSM 2132]|uniref:Uncharacterized protein n=1 Tax=Rhodothalassium salexigens DSM 2132 TaxID=1188247 RepID=A0A4V2SNT8_RHOSA|nr:hypothetical protein [Rhodothalassium salexigens]MBB4212333.1 membrane protein implicated in regulation of membrane protease activity [Rhodothalassium salexigens DSM 2132]MBK1638833.1 hypothetical protein [Rhodothalassium salexigens DSM 2132]TCP32516.1 hypothetical protein EV659_1098 [Rhodothalassium salexigens DSM 2132]
MTWLAAALRTLRGNWVELAVIIAVTMFIPSFVPLWVFAILLSLLAVALVAQIVRQYRQTRQNRENQS